MTTTADHPLARTIAACVHEGITVTLQPHLPPGDGMATGVWVRAERTLEDGTVVRAPSVLASFDEWVIVGADDPDATLEALLVGKVDDATGLFRDLDTWHPRAA